MSTVTYLDGRWVEGNPVVIGLRDHVFKWASSVFDGGRVFDGLAPDLDRHCARLNRSAPVLGLEPIVSVERMVELTWEGVSKFHPGAHLYVRPMYWAVEGFLIPAPESTRFALSLVELPMRAPGPQSACLSSLRRPHPTMAPTRAKATCHYPHQINILREARARGFDTAVVLDGHEHVAEFTYANLWMAKDGEAHTPAPNGTFLDGITRQRVVSLLRDAGICVHERSIRFEELMGADEVFSTGNLDKVMPLTRLEDRELAPGPIFRRARELYWEWASTCSP